MPLCQGCNYWARSLWYKVPLDDWVWVPTVCQGFLRSPEYQNMKTLLWRKSGTWEGGVHRSETNPQLSGVKPAGCTAHPGAKGSPISVGLVLKEADATKPNWSLSRCSGVSVCIFCSMLLLVRSPCPSLKRRPGDRNRRVEPDSHTCSAPKPTQPLLLQQLGSLTVTYTHSWHNLTFQVPSPAPAARYGAIHFLSVGWVTWLASSERLC